MSVNIFSLISRNLGVSKTNVLLLSSGKKPTLNLGYILSANITSKANRDPDYKRKAPFPYKEKKYTYLRSLIDRTSQRLDENSKIIVVDGPIAVGKSKFAKELAENLDMLYMPEANMDKVYINSYGFDQRSLNDQLPPNIKRPDEKSFCLDPYNINSASLQFYFLELRLSMYADALAHLMNTGQGVVMTRCFYSDMVFAEAMAKAGYIRKPVLKAYYAARNEVLAELLRPHLQIYLDIPVSVVQERIKARGRDWEINGKALTPEFLETMEDVYKRKYLPQIEEHAELLIYDWSEFGDLELIIEDIERLSFDKYTVYDKKMRDWRFPKEMDLANLRMQYTDYKYELLNTIDLPMFECPELYMDGEEQIIEDTILKKAPGFNYTEGYNADQGDTGILFKLKTKKPEYPNL